MEPDMIRTDRTGRKSEGPQCERIKRNGEQCLKFAMHGRKLCRNHGGTIARGPAHHSYKHGGISKFLPTRIRAQYEEFMEDEDYMSLQSDIALNRTNWVEAIQGIEDGDGESVWLLLQDAFGKLQDAGKKKDKAAMNSALGVLDGIINKGAGRANTWRDVRRISSDGRQLKETQHRMLVDQEQMITTERFLLLLGVLVDIIHRRCIERHVDLDLLKEITNDIQLQILDRTNKKAIPEASA